MVAVGDRMSVQDGLLEVGRHWVVLGGRGGRGCEDKEEMPGGKEHQES